MDGVSNLGGLNRRGTASTAYGVWHLITVVALIALLGLTVCAASWTTRLSTQHRAVVAASGTLWLVALLGVAESGHAGVDKPVWLGSLSTVIRLLAMSTWAGGLVMLTVLVIPAATPAPVPIVLRRFSAVALSCVIALDIAGTYQAWRETRPLPRWSAPPTACSSSRESPYTWPSSY